ncbi:MAG: transglycosylase SLT domain-containing protein [Burkholderiaceae bacterium]|jgi:hypothetical protein|nr:transglycosylase SLT domain-containing protein [Burkholderiaceae bacterium]
MLHTNQDETVSSTSSAFAETSLTKRVGGELLKHKPFALACIAGLFFIGFMAFQLHEETKPAAQDTPFQGKSMVPSSSPVAVRVNQDIILPSPSETRESAMIRGLQEKVLLVDWISRRYPVKTDSLELFVSATYLVAQELGLDPHLILAVMAIESRFDPEAESPVGAQGLMQVMTKAHSWRFEPHGGIAAAKDPVTNIRVGSTILKEYVTKKGTIEGALKSYVGAALLSSDLGYGAKVLAEYRLIKTVADGKRNDAVPSMSRKGKASLARERLERNRSGSL